LNNRYYKISILKKHLQLVKQGASLFILKGIVEDLKSVMGIVLPTALNGQ